MIRASCRALVLGAALAVAGCASAPPRYFTLIAPEPGAEMGAAVAPFRFELLPVGVPAQVDVPQLVVRQGAQGVAVLNGERWIAPLGDEARGALSAELARELHTQDVSGLPAGGKPVLRIKVDLRRFDSVPGGYALIEAAWSLRVPDGGATLACTSRIRETVGPGYDALVAGHQRALATLATRIASVAPALAAGHAASCPGD